MENVCTAVVLSSGNKNSPASQSSSEGGLCLPVSSLIPMFRLVAPASKMFRKSYEQRYRYLKSYTQLHTVVIFSSRAGRISFKTLDLLFVNSPNEKLKFTATLPQGRAKGKSLVSGNRSDPITSIFTSF